MNVCESQAARPITPELDRKPPASPEDQVSPESWRSGNFPNSPPKEVGYPHLYLWSVEEPASSEERNSNTGQCVTAGRSVEKI